VQQDAGARLAPVLLPEGARVRAVGEARLRGGLHLDGRQFAAGVDHEVHFFADGGAPAGEFHAVCARIAPGEQIVQHQVFQMPAFRCRGAKV